MTELEVDRTLRIDREVTARALPMRPDGETLSAVFALPSREHDPEGKIAKAIIQDAKMNALRRAFVDSGAIWNGRTYTIQFDEERERVPEFYGRFADGVRLHLSVRPSSGAGSQATHEALQAHIKDLQRTVVERLFNENERAWKRGGA